MTWKHFILASLWIPYSLANVEKTIFLGPETVNVPHQHPTLEDLRLDVLTPENWSLRTRLAADFPTEKAPSGKTSWFLLDNLTPNQRYEVRVCWSAIQPTSFTLDTYPLPTVWETPELVASLAEYSYGRWEQQPLSDDRGTPPPPAATGEHEASVLLLRITAEAAYFTANATLMRDVPPVDVDLILDPFLGNVLPRSLAPTAAYVVAVAAVSFFVGRWVLSLLRGIVDGGDRADGSRLKKQQ